MEIRNNNTSIIISEGHGDYVLWATPAMQLLVKRLNNPKLKFGVELCPYDYYHPPDPRGPQGPCGFAGPSGVSTITDRPLKLIAEKCEVLTITFSASKEWYDEHRNQIEQLHVSPGAPGRKHHILRYSEELVDVTRQFGVYKQKYFDSIYAAMKNACLVDSEEDMAYYGGEEEYYNGDFVIVQEVDSGLDPSLLIKTFETRTSKPSGLLRITLSIIAVDVEHNSNALKTLLSTI